MYKGEKIVKKFSEFKIGDMILTVNGFEPIEEIYFMGIQPVYILDNNLKITESQPFNMYNEGKKITIKEALNLVQDVIVAPTFDCKVKSVWIIPVSSKVYALEDINKKI